MTSIIFSSDSSLADPRSYTFVPERDPEYQGVKSTEAYQEWLATKWDPSGASAKLSTINKAIYTAYILYHANQLTVPLSDATTLRERVTTAISDVKYILYPNLEVLRGAYFAPTPIEMYSNDGRRIHIRGLMAYLWGINSSNLQKALENMSQLFIIGKAVALVDLHEYRQHLLEIGMGLLPQTSRITKTKEVILKWFELSYFVQKSLKEGKAPFQATYPEYPLIKRYIRLIDFEGISQGPIPVQEFTRLSIGAPNQTLENWLEHLQSYAKFENIHRFHKGFFSILEHIQTFSPLGAERHCLGKLLYGIWQTTGEKSWMEASDHKQIEWRAQLKPGDKVGGYTIEKRIYETLCKEDKKWIFALQGTDEFVLMVPQNRLLLLMRPEYADKYQEYIPLAKMDPIDATGRYAFVENVFKSRKCRERILRKFLDEKWTPINVDLENFGSNKKGELRAIKPFPRIKTEFDLLKLEEYIFSLSKGNLVEYVGWVERAGLRAHAHSKFLERVVESTLNEEGYDVKLLAAAYPYRIPAYEPIVGYAERLQVQVKKHVNEACIEYKVKAPEKNLEQLKGAIKQQMLLQYRQEGVGRFFPDFVQRVVQRE